MSERARFTAMLDGASEDYAIIQRQEKLHGQGVAGRVLTMLKSLEDGPDGFRIDRHQHSSQTASRA